MTRQIQSHSRNGVTLIELLISIALAVALVSTSVPPIARQITHGRVNRAANLIASDLELALSIVGRQRKPVRVTVNAYTREITIADRSSTQQIVRRTYGNDSEFKLETFTSSATVDLMPQGITSGAVTYTVGIGTYTRTITMSRAGLIRVLP